jgi:hypothetical protein
MAYASLPLNAMPREWFLILAYLYAIMSLYLLQDAASIAHRKRMEKLRKRAEALRERQERQREREFGATL